MKKGESMSMEQRKKISDARIKRIKSLGFINSPETRAKMSKSFTGRIVSKETREKLSKANKGKRPYIMTDEIKSKISKSLKGKPRYDKRGKNSTFWKGGKTSLVKRIKAISEYKEWRIKVFERDCFTCQNCKKTGGYLQAHHIKPLYEILDEYKIKTIEDALGCALLWDNKNGATLCKECHKKTDSYGIKVYNKGKTQEYEDRKEFKV